jgi:hypothetical protein
MEIFVVFSDDDMQSISSAMQPIPSDIAISDVGNMMDIDEQDFSPCRRPVHDTNGLSWSIVTAIICNYRID